nr:unnamed protein product [Spirometra erinaceieuropaei]
MLATTAVSGEEHEVVLEVAEAGSPFAALLESVDFVKSRVDFGKLAAMWENNGLFETDTDATSNTVITHLQTTSTPTSSMSFSLCDSSGAETGTSDIHTAAGILLHPRPLDSCKSWL